MNDKLAIDLFCGLGGWTEGFLAEGYDVIGFDNGECRKDLLSQYPGQLVIQDVQTIDGSRFKEATVIVASPPCQAYSYRAMPWKRAKALPPPSNELFDACFRIQREASEAAGRKIPLIVENVRGAQPWVGRAKWHYGSYYLWGDVPALMPNDQRIVNLLRGDHSKGQCGSWFGDYKRRKLRGGNIESLSLTSSQSKARKVASALIAKIPFPLAQHIARVFKNER